MATSIQRHKDIFNIDQIAKADGPAELKRVVDLTVQSFHKLVDNTPYTELQKIVKEWGEKGGEAKDNGEFLKKFEEIWQSDGVANGKFLKRTVSSWHRKYVDRLRQSLIAENEVQSVSELMLIDLGVNAYFRSMQMSQIYSSLAIDEEGNTTYNQAKINLMKEITKHVELSNRQFVSTMTMLKEMRRPAINVKVQSKQTFVGQNQQFNKNA